MSNPPVIFAMNPHKSGDLPANPADILGEFWARSPVGLCLIDGGGAVTAVNEAFCRTVGRTAAELAGASALSLVSAEASARAARAHAAFIAGDDAAMEGIVYLHKSGRPLFTHVTDTRVSLGDGRAGRLMSLIDLANQVKAVGPLREHDQAENFSALAGDISNDFNNLLSIILGYTAFLQDAMPEAGRLKSSIEGIEHAVRRASNLIRQTLHLSRRDELSCQRMVMGHFVEGFYRMTGASLTYGLDFSLNVEDRGAAVSLDPQHFHHALVNLGHKIRHLAGPGGRLTVTLRQVSGESIRPKFPDARASGYMMMELRGEPPAAKLAEAGAANVWEEAVGFAERRRDLAVLVVHGIMAGHGGYLEVDARSGPALVFRLYLPVLTDAGPVAPPLPAVPVRMRTGAFTVLVVDDEETLLNALKTLLERDGFGVIAARDGVEAVNLYKAHAAEISLVLIDLGLPRMSGWEAFQKIREHTPAAKVVIMSGHLEANLKVRTVEAGALGFLQKPFALPEALAEVKRVCLEQA